MRSKSQILPKIMFYLKKALDLFKRGRLQAFNVEIDGVRFLGKELKNLELGKDALKFEHNKKAYSAALKDLRRFRRLRTKKYLFIFVSGSKEVKVEEVEQVQENETQEDAPEEAIQEDAQEDKEESEDDQPEAPAEEPAKEEKKEDAKPAKKKAAKKAKKASKTAKKTVKKAKKQTK